jgi:CBS domain-containing protein
MFADSFRGFDDDLKAFAVADRPVSIQPAAELWTALEKMGRDGVNQLHVLNGGGGDRVVGVLSSDDLVHYRRVLQPLAK